MYPFEYWRRSAEVDVREFDNPPPQESVAAAAAKKVQTYQCWTADELTN